MIDVLRVHFSGGEPMSRPDLVQLVAHAASRDLYTNTITSGALLTGAAGRMLTAGTDHIQLPFHDCRASDRRIQIRTREKA